MPPPKSSALSFDSPGMEKSEWLQIRITPELKEKLKALADAEGLSMSSYIKRIITMATKEKEK